MNAPPNTNNKYYTINTKNNATHNDYIKQTIDDNAQQ